MAKTWILDTETKGTGAHMVPLEKALQKPAARRDLAVVELERPARPVEPIEPPGPRRFKIVDIRSSQLLAEGLDTRETVERLESVGSVVDVRIYVWMPHSERWRLLTLGEQKELWEFRGRAPVVASAG